MIREFKKEDIECIDMDTTNNPILEEKDKRKILEDLVGLTYECNGEIISILLCRHDGDDVWGGMLVLSKDFKKSTKHYKHTKEMIESMIDKTKAKLIYTSSVSNETVDRWHKFLGFRRHKNTIAFNEPHTIWMMERRY